MARDQQQAAVAGPAPSPKPAASCASWPRAHLTAEHVPGRYAFHDLMRAYAAEQAHHTGSQARPRPGADRVRAMLASTNDHASSNPSR